MSDDFQNRLEIAFLSESSELISAIEADLLLVEKQADTEEIVKNILRHTHTLKGSAGMVNEKIIPEYVHAFEEVLKDFLNSDKKSGDRISYLLDHLDYITKLITVLIKDKGDIDHDEYKKRMKQLKQEPVIEEEEVNTSFGFFEDSKEDTVKMNKRMEKTCYRLFIKLHEKRLTHTWFPEHIIDDLEKIGKILNITAKPYTDIPWPSNDFTQCYFTWIIVVQTDYTREAIDDIFLFFMQNNEIEIEKLENEEAALIGEILISDGKVDKKDIKDVLDSKLKIGEMLMQSNKISQQDVTEALKKQEKVKSALKLGEELKISTKKVDKLIDLIGELIIANSNLENLQRVFKDMDLDQVQYNINKISKQMRDLILSLKMVPIGQLLARFFRIVRDISKEFGKQVNLVIEGENTELDKTMFTILQEPLLHIIRNSLDHGIETPDIREQHGKKRVGNIIIRAFQESGQITIEIEDDGRGLDRDKILKQAIDKGFLSKTETYTDEQIFDIIYEPGFSTKKKANLISGRGIGMDAVISGIKKINGTIKTRSEKGKGTIFTIKIPLTLAIIEGFLLRVGKNHFVIPLQFIAECFEIDNNDFNKDDNTYNLRGEYLTLIKLHHFFSNIAYDEDDLVNKKVVVIKLDNDKVGFVIDEIIGNIQAVIKPLDKSLNKSSILAGSTILGNGEVALIVDILNLFTKLKENAVT